MNKIIERKERYKLLLSNLKVRQVEPEKLSLKTIVEISQNDPTYLNLIYIENLNNYSMAKGVVEKILVKLKAFEKSKKFLNPKVSLSKLASKLGTNPNYLSEIINSYKGKNFNSYINELRIDFLCAQILDNPIYRYYKLSYLAEVSGFTSYKTFTTAFKNVNEISPSSYIKRIILESNREGVHKVKNF